MCLITLATIGGCSAQEKPRSLGAGRCVLQKDDAPDGQVIGVPDGIRWLPDFRLVSGSGGVITRADIIGKITIITYETRETAEVNRDFKNAVSALARELFSNDEWIGLAVIDTSGANTLTRPIWEMKLRQNSDAEGITIYGDWDGDFRDELGAKLGESNIFIVDRMGRVVLQYAGRIGEGDFMEIRGALEDLR